MARKLNKTKKSDFITVTAVVKSLFHHSKGHWSYVGSSKYPYIAVGVTKANSS